MKLKVKLMPAFMTVLSALYFIYVLSGGDTTLSADAVGGDPGGKVLPLAMAVFLFAGFLYITLKERPDGQGMDTGTKRLFLITLILSVLYVLLIRHAGFILLSSLLLYCLEYIYTAAGQDCDKKQGPGRPGDHGNHGAWVFHHEDNYQKPYAPWKDRRSSRDIYRINIPGSDFPGICGSVHLCCQQDLVQEAEGGGNEADCGPGSSYLGHGTLFICCI